jgi:hypothetical protein
VRGRSAGAGAFADSLARAGLDVVEINGPPGEPDETDVDAAVPIARDARPDVIVASAAAACSILPKPSPRSCRKPKTRPCAITSKASGAA